MLKNQLRKIVQKRIVLLIYIQLMFSNEFIHTVPLPAKRKTRPILSLGQKRSEPTMEMI
jgi:hypothetical protein